MSRRNDTKKNDTIKIDFQQNSPIEVLIHGGSHARF